MVILEVVEKVICTYQQNDPYTVQIAISILNLLCSNELQTCVFTQFVRHKVSQNVNLLESAENVAGVFRAQESNGGD